MVDVFNMKILRSYCDELLEYIEQLSYELSYALDSLLFWRGQVSVFNHELPLYSLIVYISAIYVTERPRLLPSYFFFCVAWVLLAVSNRRSNFPAPIHRSKSFLYHFNSFFPQSGQNKLSGLNIKAGEGYAEMKAMEEKRKNDLEANKELKKRIAQVRREMQQILDVLSTLNLDTTEGGVTYNPLSRLLPIQLLLKGELTVSFHLCLFRMTDFDS